MSQENQNKQDPKSGNFLKSISNRNFSLASSSKLELNDDLNSLSSEISRSSSHGKKKPSSISMFKKKLSNAAHHHGYHSHNKESSVGPTQMQHIDSELMDQPKNNNFGKQLHNKLHNSDRFTNDQDTISKHDDLQTNSAVPIQRTFSTPSFFSGRFKKNSKDNTDKPPKFLSPSKFSDKISSQPMSPVLSPTTSSSNLNFDFVKPNPEINRYHKSEDSDPKDDSSISLDFANYNQESTEESPINSNKDIESIINNELRDSSVSSANT